MTPAETYIIQLRENSKREMQWLQTREIIAMVHNASGHAKRTMKGRDVIELSFDKQKQDLQWDDEMVRRILKAWN